MAESARNIIDEWSNLFDLEVHDQVSREVNTTLGMVADGGSSREGENIRDRAADELKWVFVIASCKMEEGHFNLIKFHLGKSVHSTRS